MLQKEGLQGVWTQAYNAGANHIAGDTYFLDNFEMTHLALSTATNSAANHYNRFLLEVRAHALQTSISPECTYQLVSRVSTRCNAKWCTIVGRLA